MAACLPFFTDGSVTLSGMYPGGVGHLFTGPNIGVYHNNGYDGIGGCSGAMNTADASTAIYIGTTAVWNSSTKTGLIAIVGLGDGAIVSITIPVTIIRDLGPGPPPTVVSVKLAHGIFNTDDPLTPAPGRGTLTIVCNTQLAILLPASLADGAVGVTYPAAQQFIGSGGTAPYTFTLRAGRLPPGLSLSSGGLISGTPTTTGVYRFSVSCVDVAGNACPGVSKVYTITIPSTTAGSTAALSPGTGTGGGAGCSSTVAAGTEGGDACSSTVAPGSDSGG
jgi:hypothetical protein